MTSLIDLDNLGASSMAVPVTWTLDEALEIIRAIQPESRRFNYHLCLGGGVLNKGFSKKDLDLYFLPMGTGDAKPLDPQGLEKWLVGMWGKGEEIGGRDYPDDDLYFSRLKFMYGKLRIDVFVIGTERTRNLAAQNRVPPGVPVDPPGYGYGGLPRDPALARAPEAPADYMPRDFQAQGYVYENVGQPAVPVVRWNQLNRNDGEPFWRAQQPRDFQYWINAEGNVANVNVPAAVQPGAIAQGGAEAGQAGNNWEIVGGEVRRVRNIPNLWAGIFDNPAGGARIDNIAEDQPFPEPQVVPPGEEG